MADIGSTLKKSIPLNTFLVNTGSCDDYEANSDWLPTDSDLWNIPSREEICSYPLSVYLEISTFFPDHCFTHTDTHRHTTQNKCTCYGK